jgi:hypothetical protein
MFFEKMGGFFEQKHKKFNYILYLFFERKTYTLCEVSKKGINDDYIKLIKGAKFVCGNCGRASVSDKNICNPKPIK